MNTALDWVPLPCSSRSMFRCSREPTVWVSGTDSPDFCAANATVKDFYGIGAGKLSLGTCLKSGNSERGDRVEQELEGEF